MMDRKKQNASNAEKTERTIQIPYERSYVSSLLFFLLFRCFGWAKHRDLGYPHELHNNKTSNILVDTPSATGVLYFLGCFLSIMQLWLNKTFFDARFVNSGDDLYHRVWEILYLSALASAILHIQPVAVMSDTFASADMFAFALSLAVAQLLFVVRFVDLACFGRGQRDVLKVLAWREGSMMCVAMLVQAVAATLAGVDYFGPQGAGGNGGGGEYGTNSTGEYDGGGGGHRWLAASASAGADHSSEQSSNTTTPYADDHADEAATNTVPIWLCLLVPVLFWLSWVFQTFILFPRDGYTHKKLSACIYIYSCYTSGGPLR